jgi:glyoxylase-like metal-dependent hydrolase (beta-lactamase superfamily II)
MIEIKSFAFSPLQENTYILHTNEKAFIIDAGCYFSAEQESLKNYILEKNLTPVQLLQTHCHLDHVFGSKWVCKQFGIEMYLHPNEEVMLKVAPESGIKWGLPFENYNGPLHFLNEGDVIKLEEDELKVILAPGHSPGSICFYCEKQNFIISGDVLFNGSIGRTDLPFGDYETLITSIKEKLFVLPDETVVYSGHGPKTTIGYEKRNNPFLN